jgi:tryptophan synthase beta chain
MSQTHDFYIPTSSPFDPDELGHFGIFGGRYVPETLMPVLEELKKDYEAVRFDPEFWREVDYYYRNYVGRPSALYHAANLSEELGARVYL